MPIDRTGNYYLPEGYSEPKQEAVVFIVTKSHKYDAAMSSVFSVHLVEQEAIKEAETYQARARNYVYDVEEWPLRSGVDYLMAGMKPVTSL